MIAVNRMRRLLIEKGSFDATSVLDLRQTSQSFSGNLRSWLLQSLSALMVIGPKIFKLSNHVHMHGFISDSVNQLSALIKYILQLF